MFSSTSPAVASFIAHPPMDWVIIVVFLLVALVDALRNSTARAAAWAVSAPLTMVFINFLERAAVFSTPIKAMTSPYAASAIFLGLFFALFVLTIRIMYGSGTPLSTPLTAIIASCCVTIISLVVWLQVPALQHLWHFGPIIESLFSSPYVFWWLLGSFVGMAFVRT